MGPVCLTAPAGLCGRLLARLQRAGCAVGHAGDAPPSSWPAEALQLAVAPCIRDAAAPHAVDLALMLDHPLAEQLGWMLVAGGDETAIQHARPWLDALSPAPSAWLHAGGPGAGHFVGAINAAWATQQQRILTWLAERGPRGPAHFDPASWQALANDTQQQLRQLAISYLAAAPSEQEVAARLARTILLLHATP